MEMRCRNTIQETRPVYSWRGFFFLRGSRIRDCLKTPSDLRNPTALAR